ncbi:MAG: sigma 54-interacting transcriptional regulator [Blastocatellia bacterium]|nr:sigma 54-interacting transcriptional regulator [Blastocatellia bacterium]
MPSQNPSKDLRPESYQVLLDIPEAAAKSRDLESFMTAVLPSFSQVAPCDGLLILVQEATQPFLHLRLFRQLTAHQVVLPASVSLEDTSAGWVWTNQQPLFVEDAVQEHLSRKEWQPMFGKEVQSYCLFPVTVAEERLGVLGFVSAEAFRYRETESALLGCLARQLALGVANILIFERCNRIEQEHARHLNQLQLLLDVSNALTSRLEIRELFALIATWIHRIFECDGTALTLYDEDKKMLCAYALEPHPDLARKASPPVEEGTWLPLDEDLPGYAAFFSLEPYVATYEKLKESASPLVQQVLARGIRTGCAVPLVSRGKPLGTLDIVRMRDKEFTPAEISLQIQVARQIAIAVDNALNFKRARQAEQEAERERDHLRFLLEVNNAVVAHLDLHELVCSISNLLRNLMPLEAAGIALFEPEQNHLRMFVSNLSTQFKVLRAGDVIQLEGTPAGYVFRSGEPLLLKRPDPERFSRDSLHTAVGGRKSSCMVPLTSHGRKLGILGIASTQELAFTEAHLELLNMISGQVAIAVENALAYQEIEALKNKVTQEKLYLEEELHSVWNFEQIIGVSPSFKRILKQVETVAPLDSTVLIYGETGTGKEIIARAIHNLSQRRPHTLVKLNCAAIPTGLLESELFGHEKGAFTGAIAPRAGRFELAHRGTLFLDEIGEIPLELQPKLLRVLQEQEFERLGSTRTQRVNVRVVAATNRDLAHLVEQNQFRRDLYYRLNVFPLTIPPLRERPEDLPLLVSYFASKFGKRMGKRIETIPTESMQALASYHWPGNIRELENFIERATILTTGPQLEIPLAELKCKTPAETPATPVSTLEATEREHILRVLRQTNWVVGGPTGAAARLGMKRTTLQSKMQKLGISKRIEN